MVAPVAAPPKTKSQALRSYDVADFPALTGREEEWRFTPLRRLRDLVAGDGAGAGVLAHEYDPLPGGISVSTVDKRDPRLGSAQRTEHDRARDRNQVGGGQQGRVAPGEAGGEQNERSEHPPPSLVIRDAADAEQQREARRERGRPDDDVDAERRAVEERIAEDAERERDEEESESQLRVAAHRPEMEPAAR